MKDICYAYIYVYVLQNQWKEMFPCLISKAATVDVICNGEGSNRNGAVQLVRGKCYYSSFFSWFLSVIINSPSSNTEFTVPQTAH